MNVLFVIVLIGLSACAPTKRQLKTELAACQSENIALLNEIGEKTDRLSRFNQIEKDGSLRQLKILTDK